MAPDEILSRPPVPVRDGPRMESRWKEIGTNIDLEGDYLPPWDRGIRVALVVGGGNAAAKFYSLQVSPDELPAAK